MERHFSPSHSSLVDRVRAAQAYMEARHAGERSIEGVRDTNRHSAEQLLPAAGHVAVRAAEQLQQDPQSHQDA